ncbi:MAG: hypothetical protein U5M51_06055 [Emticicia sp.]|nr:hypothetical protein [Emticicia sp.]
MLWKVQQRLTHLSQLVLNTKQLALEKELAQKLGITERAWYKFRDELINDLQLPICYCPNRRSYVYTEAGNFVIGFKKLSPDDAAKLNGGKTTMSIFRHYLGQNGFLF